MSWQVMIWNIECFSFLLESLVVGHLFVVVTKHLLQLRVTLHVNLFEKLFLDVIKLFLPSALLQFEYIVPLLYGLIRLRPGH